MSYYQTVMTVEKPGSQIREIISNSPGWLDIEACFPFDSSFCNHEERISIDGSYIEFVATYPDYEVYELWYEAYNEVHDASRKLLLESLEAQGCTVHRYYQETDLAQPDGVKPIEEFVTRDNLIISRNLSVSMLSRINDNPT
jgi:hypothetical protein